MPDYSKLEALAALMGPEPVCLNCGRCVLVGKCCDKYTPVVDYDLWEKERSKVRALEYVLQDFADGDCEYGDNCPIFGSRHGRCISCKAKAALAAGE